MQIIWCQATVVFVDSVGYFFLLFHKVGILFAPVLDCVFFCVFCGFLIIVFRIENKIAHTKQQWSLAAEHFSANPEIYIYIFVFVSFQLYLPTFFYFIFHYCFSNKTPTLHTDAQTHTHTHIPQPPKSDPTPALVTRFIFTDSTNYATPIFASRQPFSATHRATSLLSVQSVLLHYGSYQLSRIHPET